MLKNLYLKLTVAFMLVAFITALLVAVFIRITSADRLSQLMVDQELSSLQTSLKDYYAEYGSWDNVALSWNQLQDRFLPTPVSSSSGINSNTGSPSNLSANATPQAGNSLPANSNSPGNNSQPGLNNNGQGGNNLGNHFGLANVDGTIIVSVDPNFKVGQTAPQSMLKQGTAITLNGVVIGTILVNRQDIGFTQQESQYLQRTNEALVYGSLGALLIALIVGILLARGLTNPLKALTRAAQNISHGQLEQQVVVKSNDEIGQLAQAFNQMSQEVAKSNQLRQQMTADIAHDLRTPLTVISGYIESMQDGVLKPTPQRLSLIYSEIERLQNLVGDLGMLSRVDAGELSLNPQELDPEMLLKHSADLFRHQAEQRNISLLVQTDKNLPQIFVDEARMMQVMGNLISNALRYTPENGTITLSARSSDGQIEICVADNGEGIPADELPFIFDRFHRADKSRHSEGGESGLGLAIVKALVESHHGIVTVDSILNVGSTFHLHLPAVAHPA